MTSDEANDATLKEADLDEIDEAARLARALDERSVHEPPEDALEAASLLRVLESSELSPEREDAILRELLEATPARSAVELRRGVPWPWLFAALGLTGLAVVIGFERLGGTASPAPLAGLPEPSVELLASQAARFQGPETAEYRAGLADYRQRVFASLRSGEEEP